MTSGPTGKGAAGGAGAGAGAGAGDWLRDDAFEAVLALEGLATRTFRTPGAGASGRPFKVAGTDQDGLTVRTSQGGRVPLRAEAFPAAVKALGDLGHDDPDGWVRVSDETLAAVLGSENREHACTSYVLPLLAAAGLVELEGKRPARARAARRPQGT